MEYASIVIAVHEGVFKKTTLYSINYSSLSSFHSLYLKDTHFITFSLLLSDTTTITTLNDQWFAEIYRFHR